MRKISPIIFSVLILYLLISPKAAMANDGRKQILYLNSYQSGYAWSDNILEGIRSAFRESNYVVDLQVEYMDAKKHPGKENSAILKRLFSSKFKNTQFDAIISSDNDAFQFLLAYRDSLFPGVPVVFCGVNDLKPEQLAEHQDFSGVLEELDIQSNLDLALSLNPDKKQVVIVSDTSLSSTAIVTQIKKAMPAFSQRLDFHFWDNIPLDELLEKSRTMPLDSFLFYIPFYVETDGKYLSAGEVIEAMYVNANVPIYGAWNFLLGHGIVGGRLLDGRSQGKTAANLVLDILDGKPTSSIISAIDTNTPMRFDWKVLKKFGLTDVSLPQGTLFINKPDPTYRLDKQVVWTAAILLLSLLVFTVMMSASRNRAVRAEQELAQSRKMLRSIIDTIPQLIYWKDLRSRYVGANKRFTDFFGLLNPKDVEGTINRDILKGEKFSEEGERLDKQVMSEDQPILHEVFIYDGADHRNVVFEICKIPLHDDLGHVAGVLTTAEDITSRVDLERQLRQSQKLEAVGTFVGGIAHDFNNLLTTIINSTELTLMEADGLIAEDINRAKSAAEHGSQLVSQILTYARPSNKGVAFIDPTAPINEVLDLLESRLTPNQQVIRKIPSDLGKGMADPAHIQQIVMNLCTNSLQSMSEGKGEIIVSLNVLEEQYRELHITVQDSGPGISKEIQEQIFDPFFTTKGKHEGTGLGLAIVQGIVQGHEGQIKLSSQPGKTIFDIRIPFAEGDTSECIQPHRNLKGTERVLFVEDDSDQLELIPRSLTPYGYILTTAQGGQEALDIIMSGEIFDIIVTDFDMPGLNGIELARTLKQLNPETPIILVSGGREAAKAAQHHSGIAQMILKPYTGSSLAAAIRQTLDTCNE
jgi:PAS domain S-box-containing protein